MRRLSIDTRLTMWYEVIFAVRELIFGARMWLILRIPWSADTILHKWYLTIVTKPIRSLSLLTYCQVVPT